MRIIQELPSMKDRILQKIKVAAVSGDLSAIAQWYKVAEQCEVLIREATDLEERVRFFSASIFNQDKGLDKKMNPTGNLMRAVASGELSPKQEGALIRDKWVKMLSKEKNIIVNGHGKRFTTKNNKSIGIAFANEQANKWFLGLKDEPIDVIVLLCQDREKKLNDFVIPFSSLSSLWRRLSRSKGQIKFHVQRENNNFFFGVPSSESICITRFCHNYQYLDIMPI